MVARSISVKLDADVSRFKADLQSAGKAAADVARQTETAWDSSTTKLGKLTAGVQQNAAEIQALGNGMMGVGAAIGAGVAGAVTVAARFEQAMANVGAATMESSQNMELLAAAARKAGKDTMYSATEAAGAIEELSKAGVSTADILNGGLAGALDLAAAGQVDVAFAAETAATAMTQFGLAGSSVTHIADLLAAGAGKAQGSVEDIAGALNQSGLVASQFGLTVEETTGALAMFASAGLTGSDAGTSFKTMLTALANPAEQTKARMEELGLSAYDAQGNFVGLEDLAAQLQSRLGGLTQAQRDQTLAMVFGTDAVRAANVLYKEGAEGVADWESKVNDAGYAQETAAAKTDTLIGDVERLGGALEDLGISIGEGGVGPLRGLVQGLEDAVEWFGSLPGPVQQSVLAVGGVASAALLAGGAFVSLVPNIADTVTSIGQLNARFPAAVRGFKNVAGAAGIATAAVAGLMAMGAISEHFDEDVKSSTDLSNALTQMSDDATLTTESLEDMFNVVGSGGVKLEGLAQAFQFADANGWEKTFSFLESGFGIFDSKVGMAKEAVESFDGALTGFLAEGNMERLNEAWKTAAAAAEEEGITTTEMLNTMPAFKAALIEKANALGVGTDEMTLAAIAAGDYNTHLETLSNDGVSPTTEAVQGLNEALGATYDSMLALGIINQTEMEALDNLYEAIDAVDQRLGEDGFKATLDSTTEAGRQNRDVLYGIGDAGRDSVEAMQEAGASQEEIKNRIRQTYDALVDAAKQFGATDDEAEQLAESIIGIPADKDIEVYLEDLASDKADEITTALAAIKDKTVWVKVNETYTRTEGGEQVYSSDRYGNNMAARAYGAIDVAAMARGGLLTEATMVKPGTFRLVGDRLDVPEAFIPLDGSARSIALLQDAIRLMPGFGGAMADGGITGAGDSAGGVPAPDTTAVTDVWQAMFDTMLATAVAGWAAQTETQTAALATMLTGTTDHYSATTALVQAQYATIGALVTSALQTQTDTLTSTYQVQSMTVADALASMAGVHAERWAGMQGTLSTHLSAMSGSASLWFGQIRSTGETQMDGLATGVGEAFGGMPGSARTELQEVADVLNGFADAVNEAFGELGVSIPHVPAFRDGGDIVGPGSGTSDSILARVSNGEYIMPATRTAQYHAELEMMRRGIFPQYAGGGLVDLDAAAKWLQAQGVRITEFGAWGQPVGGHSPNSWHYRSPGLAFDANAGPGGQNATETAIFNRLVPVLESMWPGLRYLWQVAGHYDHLHVDAGGSGAVGAGTSSLLSSLSTMPSDLGQAYEQAAKQVGGQLVNQFAGQLPDSPWSGLGRGAMDAVFADLVSKAREYGDSFIESAGESTGAVERWRPMVKQALAMVGLPTTDAYVGAWMRQIKSESGGNPNAVQQVIDVNSGGNEAVGLVQVIPGTFAAYRSQDLPNDRTNPLASLYAGMNYAKHRYGTEGMLSVIGHGHGYGTGTVSAQRGIAVVGEHGPEAVMFGGGERVIDANRTRSLMAPGGGVTAGELAAALDGVGMTLMVDGQPMRAFVTTSVSRQYATDTRNRRNGSRKVPS